MAIKINVKALEVPIHRFGKTVVEGDSDQRELLGGKGANLCGMSTLGIPVPPGFIIPTTMCTKYTASRDDLNKFTNFCEALKVSIARGLKHIQAEKGKCLVSVRSGARVSMPGMMDTILNVGVSNSDFFEWAGLLGERTALDSYRRLYQMYGSVALGIPMKEFDEALESCKHAAGVATDSELDADALHSLLGDYQAVYKKYAHTLPTTMEEQVLSAALAVFESWNNPRAIEYRKIHNIPDSWGTAVTVQAMVFGNMNDNSATGVLFSRDPSNGTAGMVGEFLINAQGEDVVAGIRTPIPIAHMSGPDKVASGWGTVHHDLTVMLNKLEKHYGDMQDVEFTVEDGQLYILQTRNGKRSAKAAFQIAYDLVQEGLIMPKEVKGRITPEQLKAVMSDTIDPSFKEPPHLTGIAAGGSVVSGVAMFTAENAVNCTEPCILVTKETDPDDIAGMNAAVGILTATGGLTSHAAVVARGMNKSCVVGCADMQILGAGGPTPALKAYFTGGTFMEGDKITIDGSTGNVWVGIEVPVIKGEVTAVVLEVVAMALGKEKSTMCVYLDPWMTGERMQDEIAKAPGAVYVEMAPFMAPHALIEPAITALGNIIFLSDKDFVLNFSRPTNLLPPEDQVYFDLFNGSWHTYEQASKEASAAMMKWITFDRVTVMGEVPNEIKANPTNHKPKMSLQVACFADLLNSTGPVSVSKEVIASVFGGQMYFDKAVELVEGSTGTKLSGAAATSYYWYDLFNGAHDATNADT